MKALLGKGYSPTADIDNRKLIYRYAQNEIGLRKGLRKFAQISRIKQPIEK